MKQEDKELLLKDLSGRIPYKVMGSIKGYKETYYDSNSGREFTNFIDNPVEIVGISLYTDSINLKDLNIPYVSGYNDFGGLKPYLRPMSSMTEEEKKELKELHFYYTDGHIVNDEDKDFKPIIVDEVHCFCIIDWLNAHHFDYRGLIEKGLALTAPEGMYDLKKK